MYNYKEYSIENIKEAKRVFYKSSKCIQEILTKLKGLSLKPTIHQIERNILYING